jgi:hypothetical protein
LVTIVASGLDRVIHGGVESPMREIEETKGYKNGKMNGWTRRIRMVGPSPHLPCSKMEHSGAIEAKDRRT